MKTVVLRNNASAQLRIMLEPWTECYDIDPGETVEILCDLKDGEVDFEINFEDDSFLGIWVPYGAKVLSEGQEKKKIQNS